MTVHHPNIVNNRQATAMDREYVLPNPHPAQLSGLLYAAVKGQPIQTPDAQRWQVLMLIIPATAIRHASRKVLLAIQHVLTESTMTVTLLRIQAIPIAGTSQTSHMTPSQTAPCVMTPVRMQPEPPYRTAGAWPVMTVARQLLFPRTGAAPMSIPLQET
jgi:hypothetical protein